MNNLQHLGGRLPALPLLEDFLPKFLFSSTRWSDFRKIKVEKVNEKFQKEPSSVFIFKDPKLGDDQLALIKASHLESLIKINKDLNSGEAAIKQSFEGAFHAINTLILAIEKSNLEKKDALLSSALDGVKFHFKGSFKSTVIISKPFEEKKSPELSKEDKELFEELTEGEE